MRKLKIYLDTSVISHLQQEDAPEKMADTLRLWNMIQEEVFDVVMSDVVFDELDDCPEPKRSYLAAFLGQINYERVLSDDDTVILAG